LSIDRTFTLHTDEGNSYIPDILDPDDTAPEPDDLNFQVIRGTNSAERLIGGDGDDRIIALQGNDTLSGKSGNDILFGGLGRDILTGGSGSDLFVFDSKVAKKNNTNVDTIRDFHVQDDRILLAKNVFSKIGKIGDLSKKSFWIGSHAHDADDRVIYNKKTGALYYDSDGTGHNAQIHIATLSKSLKMTYSDFYVI